jgi:acyl carrier protein
MTAKSNARELLAEVLRIDIADIPENPSPENVEDWDSLAHSEILMALEDHIGRELDAEEIATLDGVEDIQAILDKAAEGD